MAVKIRYPGAAEAIWADLANTAHPGSAESERYRAKGLAASNDYAPVRSLMRCLTAAFPLARVAKPKRVAVHVGSSGVYTPQSGGYVFTISRQTVVSGRAGRPTWTTVRTGQCWNPL